ncbi:pentapeptide repeat-containing protein, partial [Gordonia rhizosphera]
MHLATAVVAAGEQATGQVQPWFGLTQPWATLIAAIGVIVAASITFSVAALNRRQTQEHWETINRQTRFTTIATQLADPNPAVRIAGVAAMEALIDDWLTPPANTNRIPWHRHLHPRMWAATDRADARRQREQRFHDGPHPQAQAGINVLCAYLRLPATTHPTGDSATTHPTGDSAITHETITITRGRTGKGLQGHHIEQTRAYQHDDHEVRNSILRTIVDHLRDIAPGQSWQSLYYDFTGANLHNADFTNTTFQGTAKFSGARFHGEQTSFDKAQFHGDRTLFDGAQFRGERTWFGEAQFHGKRTSFGGAQFHGKRTSFGGAQFHAEQTSFDKAQFHGEWTLFGGAQFHGVRTLFGGAQFHGVRTLFGGAQFHGE